MARRTQSNRIALQLPGFIAHSIPRLAITPVHRHDLCRRFDRARSCGGCVVLVYGMAGTGKTVAISEWLRCTESADSSSIAGWVTLSDDHNDAGIFWTALAQSLNLPWLIETLSRGQDISPWSAAVVVADVLGNLDGAPTVVLDDVHTIHDPLVLAGLAHLLELLPAHVTVVVASRFLPALPWHQLDLKGRLVRVGPAELSFSRSDTAQLLASAGVDVGPDELEVTTGICGGWAAMIRMAALLLATSEDVPRSLASLAASGHPSISDFLAGELLDSMNDEHLVFLTTTSVPDEFDLDLAIELVGPDAPRMLSELRGLQFPLLEANSGDAEVFRYHPMMRAHLRSELMRTRGAVGVRRLELHVGRWYCGLRVPVQAIRHILSSHDRYELSKALLELGPKAVLGSRARAFLRALDTAPPDVADDPWVHLLRSIHGISRNALADAEAFLEAASRRSSAICPSDLFDRLYCAVEIDLRSRIGHEVPVRALPEAVQEHRDIEAYVAVQRAKLSLSSTAVDKITRRLLVAASQAEFAKCPRPRLEALMLLSLIDGANDRVVSMGVRALAAVQSASAACTHDSADLFRCVVMCRFSHFLTGTAVPVEVAAPWATSIGSDGTMSPLAGWDWHALATLVMLPESTDKVQAARAVGEATRSALSDPAVHPLTAPIVPLTVQALVGAHNYELAQRIVQLAAEAFGQLPEVLVASAILHLSRSQVRSCPRLVDAALAHPDVRLVTAIQAHVVRAVVRAESGHHSGGFGDLECALSLAEPQHLVQPFVSTRQAIQLLDVHAGKFGPLDTFVDRIRTRPDAVHTGSRVSLTPAERRVLQHLGSGQSTQDIAETLVVSVNTVKTHLRGIYAKLGVASRREAIIAARVAGLL